VGSVGSYLADALVILGVLVMTVGVYGVVRLPDTYTKMHAASKVVVLGVVSLLVASTVTADPGVILRAVLIGAFLVLTTPVASHAIARATYMREKGEAEGPAGRESGGEHPG
jgi:multicomponent Na+:H+ antiporter subunit G